MAKKLKVVKLKLEDLRPHPRQSELFPNLSDYELGVLASDMERNGQERPIEVTAAGEIIAGKERVRAARLLNWSEIDAVIRDDLEQGGPCAVVARLIEDNLLRRQLDPLAIARCVRELVQQYEHSSEWQRREEMLEEIAQRIKRSRRMVNRYLRALATSPAVQQAVQDNKLSLVQAGRVAGLHPDVQAQIAERIASGENPKRVIKEYFGEHRPARRNLVPAYGPFVTSLKRFLELIPGPDDDIIGNLTRELTVNAIQEAITKLSNLKRRIVKKLGKLQPPDTGDDCAA